MVKSISDSMHHMAAAMRSSCCYAACTIYLRGLKACSAVDWAPDPSCELNVLGARKREKTNKTSENTARCAQENENDARLQKMTRGSSSAAGSEASRSRRCIVYLQHDGHPLCVDRAQVGVLKEVDHEVLGGLKRILAELPARRQ